jgi:choline kinase
VDEIKDSMCKSTGVFYLAREKIKTVSGWFRKAVEEKKTGLYYDLILGEHLCDMPIYVHNVYPRKWAEIDTPEELEEAERFLA